MRRLAVLAVIGLVAAACGGGSRAATTATVAAKAKTLHVVLRGQDHHPRVGKAWHYTVRVTDAATGRPVACRIHLQVLYQGTPVGQIGVHRVKTGVWKETIGAAGNPPFPAAARGLPIDFQAVVTAPGYRRATANWPIVVK